MAIGDARRLAVLIDADSASSKVLKALLEEEAKYGTATVKRAYGDRATQNLGGWKAQLHRYAVQPIQQFAYTEGKNSTESAFIIDAMDLLYADNVDGFCLVSSDSDFTRLATRLREAGKVVYGLGEKKTPAAFIAACDKFIFVEVLQEAPEAAAMLFFGAMNIAQVLDQSQISQAAFAESVGVSQSMVWQWIEGRRPVPEKRCTRIERIANGAVIHHESGQIYACVVEL
ncbi:NYN domain-containing protein [Pigmentiphaga sp. YJ18]|uniref:NYN domain-containing protein n=1 Tax=Pigmentiphaga sp. YJ18 TaxID=3134907 RepID=UPI00311662ED